MKTIWRFDLDITDVQRITAPGLSRALAVEDRRGTPELWVEVDTFAKDVIREVYIVGTGNDRGMTFLESTYVGHFLAADGSFVGHVYFGSQDQEASE